MSMAMPTKQMNNSSFTDNAAKKITHCVIVSFVLLLSACDGGIFGTGGSASDLIATDTLGSAPITDQVDSAGDTLEGSIITDSVTNVTEGVQTETDDVDTGVVDSVNADNTSTTDDVTDGAIDGDVSNPTADIEDLGPSSSITSFTNEVPTLDINQARISLFNATATPLVVFETGVTPETLLFDVNGVTPNTISGADILSSLSTSISIVNAINLNETVATVSSLNVAASTLTSIVVREVDQQFSVIALATETTTTDAALTRVRIVQAGSLGDINASLTTQLVSAGDNPSGMDAVLGTVSFTNSQTDYIEIVAGEYELSDDLGLIEPQLVNLTGGSVFTIVLVGNGDNSLILINDTDLRE